MCLDPITGTALATTGLAAAETTLQFIGQSQVASINREAAGIEATQEFNALTARSLEVEEANAGDVLAAAIESARLSGAIVTGAAEGGFSDGQVVSLIQSGEAGIGRQLGTNLRQGELQQSQINREATAVNSRRAARVAANANPNPAQLLIGLGSAGLQGFNSFRAGQAASVAGP